MPLHLGKSIVGAVDALDFLEPAERGGEEAEAVVADVKLGEGRKLPQGFGQHLEPVVVQGKHLAQGLGVRCQGRRLRTHNSGFRGQTGFRVQAVRQGSRVLGGSLQVEAT